VQFLLSSITKRLLVLGLIFSSALAWSAEFVPKSFSINFEQIIKSTHSGRLKKSLGTLDYQKPGKIRFEVTEPEHTIFISNLRTNWYYTAPFIPGEKGEVIIEKSNSSGARVLGYLFESLRQGLKSNNDYTVKMSEGNSILEFSKSKERQIGISKAILNFKDKSNLKFENLAGLSLVYSDKKQAKLVLKRIEVGTVYNASFFNFQVPPNTNITNAK